MNIVKADWIENVTDNIGNVQAIGEAAGGTVSRIINAIRRWIGTGAGDQVVVVAVVDERVAKDEESPSLSYRR